MAGVQIDGVNNKIDFDDDQDTSISSSTDDTLVIESGGVNIASITAGEFAINEGSGSIDFRVESNDDANMLLVDASGNAIGVGTNSPALSNGRGIVVHGGSSIARLELRNDTSGATANDGAFYTYSGTDAFLGNREAGTIQFWNNGAERMRIDSSGNAMVAVSTANAEGGMTIDADGGLEGTCQIRFNRANSTGSSFPLSFMNNSGTVGFVSYTNSATTFSTSSDYRLKENVVTDWDATTRLKQLKPSRFNFKVDTNTTLDGFLAHEVSDIVPEAITGEKDAVDSNGDPEYQGIDQSKLVPLLVKTVQELESRIKTLEDA